MAKQRYINTFFWDDPYIEDLCPHGKLLFIYLVTNPLTNLAGSFEITVKKISDQTGLSRDEISDLLSTFEKDGKVIYRDRWILVVNAIKHQNWETHATIRTGICTIVSQSPQWVKDRLCIAYEWLSHLNLDLNLDSNSEEAETAATITPVERRIWADGVDLLIKNGMTEASARPLLGRLVKQYTKPLVAEAIAVTQAENSADPKTFLIGVLKERSGANYRKSAIVGKNTEPPPIIRCNHCLDSGEISQPVPADRSPFSGAVEFVPCPGCRLEAAA